MAVLNGGCRSEPVSPASEMIWLVFGSTVAAGLYDDQTQDKVCTNGFVDASDTRIHWTGDVWAPFIYIVTLDGSIFCLSLRSGRIFWNVKTMRPVFSHKIRDGRGLIPGLDGTVFYASGRRPTRLSMRQLAYMSYVTESGVHVFTGKVKSSTMFIEHDSGTVHTTFSGLENNVTGGRWLKMVRKDYEIKIVSKSDSALYNKVKMTDFELDLSNVLLYEHKVNITTTLNGDILVKGPPSLLRPRGYVIRKHVRGVSVAIYSPGTRMNFWVENGCSHLDSSCNLNLDLGECSIIAPGVPCFASWDFELPWNASFELADGHCDGESESLSLEPYHRGTFLSYDSLRADSMSSKIKRIVFLAMTVILTCCIIQAACSARLYLAWRRTRDLREELSEALSKLGKWMEAHVFMSLLKCECTTRRFRTWMLT